MNVDVPNDPCPISITWDLWWDCRRNWGRRRTWPRRGGSCTHKCSCTAACRSRSQLWNRHRTGNPSKRCCSRCSAPPCSRRGKRRSRSDWRHLPPVGRRARISPWCSGNPGCRCRLTTNLRTDGVSGQSGGGGRGGEKEMLAGVYLPSAVNVPGRSFSNPQLNSMM